MEDLHEEFSRICKADGWKLTPQRFAVYRAVRENYTHPSVDTIHEKIHRELPAMTRESVYRILNEFAEKGVIVRMDDLNSARYDWKTAPHGHFFCRVCGNITDFVLPEEIPYPEGVDVRSLSHVELRLAGICPECSQKQNPPGNDPAVRRVTLS